MSHRPVQLLTLLIDSEKEGREKRKVSRADKHSAWVQMGVYVGHAQYGAHKFTAGARTAIIPQQYRREELI